MVFDRIYETNAWGGGESPSGPGSGSDQRQYLGPAIVELALDLGVRSVLDLGCGDGFWMPDLPGYRGFDVSPRAINLSRARHPYRDYTVDIGGNLPRVDLVISRCVLQHLSFADGLAMLQRIRDSGSRWLLATTYHIDQRNVDVRTGDGFWIDMETEPFNLGPAEREIVDLGASADHGGALGLWRLQGGT